MKIIVVGSRTFTDKALLFRKLDRLTRKLKKVIVVTSGEPKGFNTMVRDWAFKNRWTSVSFHNESPAVVMRESSAGVLIVFGDDAGTKAWIETAKKNDLKIKEV